ncbi:MAG: D-alanyl-D-alanine carboxypeptidase, partial [Gammaproteobacteria bacterium]|nr:D-alanyl-D-alanine carboxypeptidase [Gammaproteobacteria bacterium]
MYRNALSLVFALLLAMPAIAQVPAPPDIEASGYLLIDFDSSTVLATKDAEQRLEPASLTKIMTAYAVFHELRGGSVRLTDEVVVSEKAWKTPGSRMFIEVNKRVAVDDLLKGMIIQSGN